MTEFAPLRARGGLIDALSSAVDRAGHGLTHAPPLLRRVLDDEAWREFETLRGEVVVHTDFADFVTTPPLKGLGTTVELVRRMIADDPRTLDLFDQVMSLNSGERGHSDESVVGVARPIGTSQAAVLRRLHKDAPALHAQVVAGELSPHAAMVKAGFRARTISVSVSRPETAARALKRNFSPEQLIELIALLRDEETN